MQMTYRKAEQRSNLSFTKTMLAHRLSFMAFIVTLLRHTKETLEVVNSRHPFGINERFSFE